MIFSRRLTPDSLIDLCRSMRYSLSSGRMPHDTMQLLAAQGPRRVRPVARRVVTELKSGWGLQEALKKQGDAFPPLFLALTAVGEETGMLPEVLEELEKYYVLRQKLRRAFFQEIAWPVFQLFAAVLVIAGLIYVAGAATTFQGAEKEPVDALGLGLVGPAGAVKFLQIVFVTVVVGGGGFWLLKRLLRRRAIVERALLWVPVLGSCLRSIVLARFCLALHSLLKAGLPIRKVLRLAFLASDHPVFTAALPKAEEALRHGNSITASLDATGVFPKDFLCQLAIAEESGQLPDVLDRQAQALDEQAGRRLVVLNRFASWFVWFVVALTMGLTIYRVFSVSYERDMEALFKRQG